MKYCNKCLKPQNSCTCTNNHFFEIDYLIYPIIYELNRKGYATSNCCSAHPNSNLLNPYIMFKENYSNLECSSELFSFETYRYKGVEKIRKEFIRPTKESVKYYRKLKDETARLMYLIEFNKQLYYWAKSLPFFIENNDIEEKEFYEIYFDDYVNYKEINPFLFVVNPAKTQWNDYLGLIFKTNSPVEAIGIKNNHIYDNIHINVYDRRNSILNMLSNTCTSLILSNEDSFKFVKHNLFENQCIIFSPDNKIYSTNAIEQINNTFYTGESMIESLLLGIKNNKSLSSCNSLFITNGDINIIIANKETTLYLCQFEDNMLITNINNISENSEFSELKLNDNSYLIFIKDKLLLKGVF